MKILQQKSMKQFYKLVMIKVSKKCLAVMGYAHIFVFLLVQHFVSPIISVNLHGKCTVLSVSMLKTSMWPVLNPNVIVRERKQNKTRY